MGAVSSIDKDKFPKQGDYLGRRMEVIFHMNTSDPLRGTMVRDDVEEPNLTIIRLDDGRHVLGTECQYSPLT